MTDLGRKISINVRSHAKKHSPVQVETHTKKSHEETAIISPKAPIIPAPQIERALHVVFGKESTPRIERIENNTSYAEPLVPAKVLIPKKPMLIEGVEMNALSIGYFCMEMGILPDMPTYAGGLGILAGDMLKSCADQDIAIAGVTLLYRKGYFKQRIDQSGWQFEEEEFWDPREHLIPLSKEVIVNLEGRNVHVRAWMYKLSGIRGNMNPVIFLDTDIEGNSDEDRHLTDKLYSGDSHHRLLQEAILGIGGLRMLIALGATNIRKFHMNEGHAALLTIELYRQYSSCDDPKDEVMRRAVFTTHTPVAAGHDHFSEDLVRSVLGLYYIPSALDAIVFKNGTLNMTELALQLSSYINGVARRHGEVTRQLFPGYQIESITNGVYARGWTGESMGTLFDRYLPSWRSDPYSLRYALAIPGEELWQAHMEEKRALIDYVNKTKNIMMDPEIFTIGFARRATAYKRGNMLFSDIERLKSIAEKSKGIQIIYAGKAHPNDNDGKLLIQHIIANMGHLGNKVKAVYIENYDMKMAKRLVSGVDLWLNTPTRPQEASGTSGMKAALNGIPQFSILDGWWIEGHIEGATGWSIGAHPEDGERANADQEDAEDMYRKLEYVILPLYENERGRWIRIMRQAIAVNGSFFNTHRMVLQYTTEAYYK